MGPTGREFPEKPSKKFTILECSDWISRKMYQWTIAECWTMRSIQKGWGKKQQTVGSIVRNLQVGVWLGSRTDATHIQFAVGTAARNCGNRKKGYKNDGSSVAVEKLHRMWRNRYKRNDWPVEENFWKCCAEIVSSLRIFRSEAVNEAGLWKYLLNFAGGITRRYVDGFDWSWVIGIE